MILLIMNLLMKIKPINLSIHNQVNLELLEINNKYYNYSRIHVKKEIAISVLEAFQLLEEMSRSHKNLLGNIAFGRDLYYKGSSAHGSTANFKLWPTSWSACINILKEFGYKEPRAYYICLDASHQNLWSTKDSPTDLCQ